MAVEEVFDVDLRKVLREWDARRARSRQKKPGPSSLGGCRRRLGYQIAGQKKDNWGDPAKAIQGTLLHKGVLAALKTAHGGLTEVRLEDELLLGSCDWLRFDPLGLPVASDVKTVGKDIFELKIRTDLSLEHKFQVNKYAAMLRAGSFSKREKRIVHEPVPVVDIEIITLCRDDGRAHTRRVPFDQDVADEATDRYLEVQERVAVDGVGLIPRDQPGPESSPICRNCPFLNACWGPQDEDGRRAPLELTAPELEEHLIEYRRGHELETEGKRIKALARGHLDGQDPGESEAGWRLGWTGGKPKLEVVPDVEKLVALVESAGLSVPLKTVDKGAPARISVLPPKRKAE